ncbi:MAG: LPXTG cell wall anchor domain-containing protein [Egibacteraceae bacterium]
MRKLITIGLAAGLLLTLMTLPAAAQDAYPPAAPECTLSDSVVEAGDAVTVSCVTWAANTPVTGTLFSTPVVLGTTVTDAQGRLTEGFTIPASTAPGPHTLRMSGLNRQNVQTNVDLALEVVAATGVTPPTTGVTPPRAVPAPRLPRTGGDALLALGLAAGLLAAGGGALGVARRRNQAELSA